MLSRVGLGLGLHRVTTLADVCYCIRGAMLPPGGHKQVATIVISFPESIVEHGERTRKKNLANFQNFHPQKNNFLSVGSMFKI